MKKVYIFFFALIIFSCSGKVTEDVSNLRRLNDERAVQAAKDAYIFGYPLVYSQIIKRYMTNDSSALPNKNVNAIIHYPLADFKFKIFPYPDPQTYYSCVWIDVSNDPVLLEIPALKSKSLSKTFETTFALFDAWSNIVLNSSNFSDEGKSLKFAVTSKKWSGVLPKDFIKIYSDTDMAFFIYGIKNEKKENSLDTIVKHRKNMKVYPLNFRKNPSDMEKTLTQEPPLKQMQSLRIEEFFNMLNALMLDNRPLEKDAQALDSALDIGVSPGMRFEPSSFSETVLEKIKSIPSEFFKENDAAKKRNAWEKMQSRSEEKAGYYFRAKTAFQNIDDTLGGNYARIISEIDADGKPFDSSKNKYVLRLKKNQIPQGKWSLAIYDADGFLIKNQLNRYFLSDESALKRNADGSLNIYIQQNSPAKDKISNWLASGQKSFKLIFKIYLSSATFDETVFPAVKRIQNKR
jgi:hypothetical protein